MGPAAFQGTSSSWEFKCRGRGLLLFPDVVRVLGTLTGVLAESDWRPSCRRGPEGRAVLAAKSCQVLGAAHRHPRQAPRHRTRRRQPRRRPRDGRHNCAIARNASDRRLRARVGGLEGRMDLPTARATVVR